MRPFKLIGVFDRIRQEWFSTDAWHDVVMTTSAKNLFLPLYIKREGSDKQDKIRRQYRFIRLANEQSILKWFNFEFELVLPFLNPRFIIWMIFGCLYFRLLYFQLKMSYQLIIRWSMDSGIFSFNRKLIEVTCDQTGKFLSNNMLYKSN